MGRLQGEPEHRVFLTARHHACEALASYVLEGLMDAVLADQQDGAWLREHVEFMVVPLVDKDGVEDGDQGKNRKPHDHNRDYIQTIYPSVREITRRVPDWSQGKLAITFDLHCPHIRGPHNEVIYFVGGRDAAIWKRATSSQPSSKTFAHDRCRIALRQSSLWPGLEYRHRRSEAAEFLRMGGRIARRSRGHFHRDSLCQRLG